MSRMEQTNYVEYLKNRFESNMHRHSTIQWIDVLPKLTGSLLEVIRKMEESDGEPDVIIFEQEAYYVDCSKETPKARVSICYDIDARLKRKNAPPMTSASELASDIGITILDESFYKALQAIEPFDLKTSSWIKTPNEIRNLGGALFGDRRYNHVFIYHNGADSYYSVRGFRGYIHVKL
jgi:hypothetical protein